MILHLSLERINSGETPYQVEPTEQNGFYQFFTDGGVHYSVGFMEDDVLLSKNSYQLIIANINNHKSPRDRKVRDTIVSIVDEFFRCNNSTLLYICETGDNKQLAVDLINQVRYRAFVTTSPTDSFAKYRKFNVTEGQKVTEEIFNSKYKIKVTDDLRKAIRHERRVELACEGRRYTDLLRWGTFVQTMQAFNKTEEGKYSGAGSNVTDKTWPYPIPQNEIDFVGGSLIQNDNY